MALGPADYGSEQRGRVLGPSFVPLGISPKRQRHSDSRGAGHSERIPLSAQTSLPIDGGLKLGNAVVAVQAGASREINEQQVLCRAQVGRAALQPDQSSFHGTWAPSQRRKTKQVAPGQIPGLIDRNAVLHLRPVKVLQRESPFQIRFRFPNSDEFRVDQAGRPIGEHPDDQDDGPQDRLPRLSVQDLPADCARPGRTHKDQDKEADRPENTERCRGP
jgi:hypothetical protein